MKQSSVFRWQTAVVVLGGLALSLSLLIVAQNLDAQTLRPAWIKPLLENIGTTVMVAATVGLLFEILTRSEILGIMDETKATIGRQIGTIRSLEEIGLIDVHPDTYTYPFADVLLSSRELVIVLNDGRSWLGRHADYLRTRMLLPNRKTVFVFQHPQSKMLQEVLSQKVGQSPDFLREKVGETIKELVSFPRSDSHTLEVLGHHFFNPYSLFVSEELAIMCPYYIGPLRMTVPTYVFEKRGKSSQYNRFYEDVQQVMRYSTSLLPAETGANP